MKVRLIQIDVIPGQPAVNGEKILRQIKTARDGGIDLVVLPEMSIPGYLQSEWRNIVIFVPTVFAQYAS